MYNCVFAPCIWIVFQVYGILNKKAARSIRGRDGLFERLEKKLSRLPEGERVWFHSSSMGEFEQAKPIIAALKKRRPSLRIIVTFFSASGYEHSQRYKLADVIEYLPFDSTRNAKRFIDLVRPKAAIIVRYDVWPNHLWAAHQAGIATFIANATLRGSTPRMLPVARQFHTAMYNTLDYILTVSEADRRVFERFHVTKPVLETAGDTRFDQVMQRSAESVKRQVLDPRILGGKKILVAGSTWEEDEEHLLPACLEVFRTHPEFLVILVPHEPTDEHLERIEEEWGAESPVIRFSELYRYKNERIIAVDTVGILMALYQHAHVAFVGGSFKGGIHNVLEPAVYGVPVLMGPDHTNSQEAGELVRAGGAFMGESRDALIEHLRCFLENETKRKEAGNIAASFVKQHTGATERFLSYLEQRL